MTSTEKCIKKVCIHLQGFITKPSPELKFFLPSSPRSLLKKVSATMAFSAKTLFLVLLIILTYLILSIKIQSPQQVRYTDLVNNHDEFP